MYYAKNPYDIFNSFRTKKGSSSSLHVKAVFEREYGKGENEKIESGKPLAAFHHSFARLVVTIISKSKAGKSFAESNVQYEKLADIESRGHYAIQKLYDQEISSIKPVTKNEEDDENDENEENEEEEKKLSPAYTVVIPTGKLKGKTPAQALQEPNGKEMLNKHFKWLQENLAKYPKNKEQMDAIQDAANLEAKGLLKKVEAASSTSDFVILEACPLSLTNKLDEKTGLCPVREIGIKVDFTQNNPFIFHIVNYDAPVYIETPTGKKRITKKGQYECKIVAGRKERTNEVKESYRLNTSEFNSLLDHINIAKTMFLNENSKILLQEAKEADEYNKKSAKAE